MQRSALILVGALVGLVPSVAAAQTGQYTPPQTSPMPRPPVSPYLNLNRSGSPAVNYYDLVKPQQNTSAAIQQLQQQQAVPPVAPPPAAGFATGHPAWFVNYSHYYYNNLGARGVYGLGHPGSNTPYTGAPLPYGAAGLPYGGLGWGSYPGVGYPGLGYPGVGYPGVGYPGIGYPGMGMPYPVPGAGMYPLGVVVP